MNIPFENQPLNPSPSKEAPALSFLDSLLPPPALPLLLLLLLVLPLSLLAGQSLLIPLFESVLALFLTGSDGLYTTLPWYFYLKLLAFVLLTFFGLFQLVLRIKTYYFTVWAQQFPQAHALHVRYQPDNQMSLVALINWTLYRTGSIFGPPLMLGLLTCGLGVVEIWLFNVFSGLPFISLPIQFIVALFLFMLFSLFTAFACANGLWTYFTTVFGDVVAVTEPELPAKTAYERCNRIAFASPMVYVFYPAYFLFVVGVLVEVYVFLSTYTVKDLITFQINIPAVLGLEILTVGMYLVLGFLKMYTYHNALMAYYGKLPLEFKDRFSSSMPDLYP